MEQVEVKDCDRVLLRALDIPASNDALMSVASHRIEATRTNDQAKDEEIARLKSALEEIVSPIATMRRRAEAEGKKLSGMAWEIARDPSYLQGIAKEALEPSDG